MSARLSACAALLRQGDHDRYLTVLAGGGPDAEALFALYALNLELARTAEVVREPLLGEIRLQWWQDSLAAAHGGVPPAHPVLEALAPLLADGRLAPEPLRALAAARLRDLRAEPPATQADLLAYADATGGQLNRLAARLSGLDEAAAEAAQAIGEAWALTGILRAVPFHARQGRILLPLDLLAGAGVAPRTLLEMKPPSALAAVVERLAGTAVAALGRAGRLAPRLPRHGRAPLLLAPLATLYLARLRRCGWDVMQPRVAAPAVGAAWLLAWRGLVGRT